MEPHDYLPAKELAEHLKVPILSPRDVCSLEQSHVQNLLGKAKGKWSGVTVHLPDGGKLILHNSTHAPTRFESDVMHELAHAICEHELSSISDSSNGFPFIVRDFNEAQEKEAIWLGGCLQIPRAGLIWALENNMDHTAIAAHFHASPAMVRFRLNKEWLLKR